MIIPVYELDDIGNIAFLIVLLVLDIVLKYCRYNEIP